MGSFQLDTKTIADNIAGTVGRVTAAVGTVLGGLTSLLMIIVLGIFIAIEPRLYERGVAWMLPMKSRENFYITTARMGFTLRRLMAGRLLGMLVEGIGTWLACLAVGIPMAALMGLLRSEEHTSELQSLMRISYAVFCLKKKKKTTQY